MVSYKGIYFRLGLEKLGLSLVALGILAADQPQSDATYQRIFMKMYSSHEHISCVLEHSLHCLSAAVAGLRRPILKLNTATTKPLPKNWGADCRSLHHTVWHVAPHQNLPPVQHPCNFSSIFFTRCCMHVDVF